MELNLLKGVSIGFNQVRLSHLQFADDSLLFCEAELSEVLALKRILRCFEVASGLKINYHKSVVCGVGISFSEFAVFASLLNCKTQTLPLKYLGLPLGANLRRKKTWQPVIDKFKLRLTGWKRRLLSFAGRLILVKAVLSSLPVYFLSLYRLPEGVAKELDKIQASFLWGGSDSRRKIHLVKWSEVTESIKQGGLGIRRVKDVNVCLLLKWWWRFASENDSLWKKIICSKYKFLGGRWFPNLSPSIKLSNIWNGIVSAVELNESLFQYYTNNLKLKVGNGSRIRFWNDNWCGNICLKDEYPRIYRLSLNKDGLLKDFVDVSGPTKHWVFTFRRPLFDWEKSELLRLTTTLYPTPILNLEAQDSAVWTEAIAGQSLVSVFYNHTSIAHGACHHPIRLVWNKHLPPKVQFFSWLAWKYKLKTSVFLQRIGILDGSTSTLCIFCQAQQETAEHVLISCPQVWKVWTGLLKWWGTTWVVPNSVPNLLLWWSGYDCRKSERRIWNAIPLVTLWSIWKHRNECVFQASSPNLQELQELIVIRIAI